MPLRHHRLLADLDLDTRILVSGAYVEACQELDKLDLSVEQLDELRVHVGNHIIRLAREGERDPEVMKATALKAVHTG